MEEECACVCVCAGVWDKVNFIWSMVRFILTSVIICFVFGIFFLFFFYTRDCVWNIK